MAKTTNNLWPESIKAEIQSPMRILRAQATNLKAMTKGTLVGDISEKPAPNDDLVIAFDVIAPTLDDYRHRIFSVRHNRMQYYPAFVDAAVLRPTTAQIMRREMRALAMDDDEPERDPSQADSDEQLVSILGKVLASPQVVAVVQSLIAKSNDVADKA